MKKLLSLFILLLLLSSCSFNKTVELETDTLSNETIESYQQDNLSTRGEQFEEFSILITTDVLRIRTSPNTDNKENIVGYAYMGEVYIVLEQAADDDYSWYRINENEWIADNGSWCAKFKSEGNEEYPYVMLDNEKEELLSELDAGTYSTNYGNNDAYLNFFDCESTYPNLDCDIFFSLRDMTTIDGGAYKLNDYKYNITYIVKINDDSYEIYVEPIEYEGLIDNSTGCLRISNIHDTYVEGEPNLPHRHFDMTFIKNKNPIENINFDLLYEVISDYGHSGQVAF